MIDEQPHLPGRAVQLGHRQVRFAQRRHGRPPRRRSGRTCPAPGRRVGRPAISRVGTRTILAPAAEQVRSSRRVRCRQSSTAKRTCSPLRRPGHAAPDGPSLSVPPRSTRPAGARRRRRATTVWVRLWESAPIMTTSACSKIGRMRDRASASPEAGTPQSGRAHAPIKPRILGRSGRPAGPHIADKPPPRSTTATAPKKRANPTGTMIIVALTRRKPTPPSGSRWPAAARRPPA